MCGFWPAAIRTTWWRRSSRRSRARCVTRSRSILVRPACLPPRATSLAEPEVVVLDYGSGNVRSAVRALERAGATVTLTADPVAAQEADGLVVPGVGAYAACMAGLRAVRGP